MKISDMKLSGGNLIVSLDNYKANFYQEGTYTVESKIIATRNKLGQLHLERYVHLIRRGKNGRQINERRIISAGSPQKQLHA